MSIVPFFTLHDCVVTVVPESETKLAQSHFPDDPELVQSLLDDLATNSFAWCQIRIEVTCKKWKAVRYLPCSSYGSRQEFLDSLEYDEEVNSAFKELIEKLRIDRDFLNSLTF